MATSDKIIFKAWPKLAVSFILVSLLGACGGGGSDNSENSPNADPIRVNAGIDITLNEGESSSIRGGSSGGSGAIVYTWQTDSEVQIVHTDTSTADAILTAPMVTEISIIDVVLVASDENGKQQSGSFVLTVLPINDLPVATISANQIENYEQYSYPVSSEILLDGSASSDADPQSQGAEISTYLWQQIAGPNLLAGVDTTQASISLTAPISDAASQVTIRLTVSDQEGATNTSEITLNLLAQEDTIPTASVSPVRDVFAGELVKLTGSAESIAPNAAPFSANWSSPTSFANGGLIIDDVSQFETHAVSPYVAQDSSIIYQLQIEDSFRNSVSAQQQGLVYAPIARTINDTGMTRFANGDGLNATYQADYAGQDADYGADRQTLSGQVVKVGEGDKGFDFTRLDNNGDALENPSLDFNCVRDNVTGLIWQVKSIADTSQIDYVEQLFSWYADDENGNFEGYLNENSSSCNVATMQCNTQAYLEQVNTQGMCGFYDWRLPTLSELQSIIHYGKSTVPLVDQVFFPHWGNSEGQALWYWTSQSSADGVSNDIARNAWAFDMHTGNDGFLSKQSEQRVILVRAGR